MARFRKRLEECKRFWEQIALKSSNYLQGIQGSVGGGGAASNGRYANAQDIYGFLED